MTHQHSEPRLQSFARGLIAIAAGFALLALAGYVAHQARLVALLPGWQGMSPLTATGVLLLALAGWSKRAVSAVAAMVLALAVLLSHAVWRNDILSPRIAETLLGFPAGASGRVSAATALCLLLLGAAIAAGAAGPDRFRRARGVADLAANAALCLGGAALLGYAYRVSDLYGFYLFNTMSLQSALAVTCLALALLIGTPGSRLGVALRSPSPAVRRLRRPLALAMLPAVLGWLLQCQGGPGGSGNGAAMALLVIATAVPMFYLLLENAWALDALDRERAAQHEVERRLTLDLQQRVDAQTAALAASHKRDVELLAHAERARRSEMIAQLTGSIAHDFNNLLMVIGGYAQLLKLRARADAGTAPLVDKIAATVAGAAKLTGQLSAFSSTQRLQAAPVHVDDVVRAALADLDREWPAQVRLVTGLDVGACTVLSDGAQLQLAVTHLVRNAWDAVGAGGSVHIATSSRSAPDGRTHVTLRIDDDGCGMTQDDAGKAVEPFFTTKRGNHPGLGLAQVHSVVQQASGTLRIVSQPGQGTSIELQFPCIDTPAATAPLPSPVPSAAVTDGARRLLVIDDDEEVRAVIVALLRQMAYDVVEAGDGETGLRMLAQHRPALAVIDYLMPGMNGAEVARRARMLAPDLAIVFVSGYSNSDDIDAIPRSRLLRKPVVVDELGQAIADALVPA